MTQINDRWAIVQVVSDNGDRLGVDQQPIPQNAIAYDLNLQYHEATKKARILALALSVAEFNNGYDTFIDYCHNDYCVEGL